MQPVPGELLRKVKPRATVKYVIEIFWKAGRFQETELTSAVPNGLLKNFEPLRP